MIDGSIGWFLDGELNVCYNCIDRHLKDKSEQVNIIKRNIFLIIKRLQLFGKVMNQIMFVKLLIKNYFKKFVN